ncbi:MAG: hypothetical protein KUG73_03865 [Pseudomonadales bacterium]|nr:hypothetical protein [Pseudomonadales bacterium]
MKKHIVKIIFSLSILVALAGCGSDGGCENFDPNILTTSGTVEYCVNGYTDELTSSERDQLYQAGAINFGSVPVSILTFREDGSVTFRIFAAEDEYDSQVEDHGVSNIMFSADVSESDYTDLLNGETIEAFGIGLNGQINGKQQFSVNNVNQPLKLNFYLEDNHYVGLLDAPYVRMGSDIVKIKGKFDVLASFE